MVNPVIPQQLYTCDEVRALDNYAISGGIPGITLMKRAGRALFNACRERWPSRQAYLVFCGAGNNAGDGYVFAALAAQKKFAVKVVALREPSSLRGDAQLAYQYALREAVEVLPWHKNFVSSFTQKNTVVVDALLGTGAKGEPNGAIAEAIDWLNQCESAVASADIPSGLNADTGAAGCAVRANLTVCFVGRKRGLYTGKGPALTGELCFDGLDIPHSVYEKFSPRVKQVGVAQFLPLLKRRPADAHKGLFGHVMVVGGDKGFGGAVTMAAEAALYAGAGLVSVATQPAHLASVLARAPEIMVHGVDSGQALSPLLDRPTVIVIGPGLGQSAWSEQLLQKVLATDLPLIVDADALNILAKGRVKSAELRRQNWVLTPHPGEAARLLGVVNQDVQVNRFAAAERIQQRYGGVTVLKGAGTLIASENSTMLAKVGNPGMAAAGMGDVLAGLCGALLAGQCLAAEIAAATAVCVHGCAGDKAAEDFGGESGLRATELLLHIRRILNFVKQV
ncbi:MAG: NAD(P)H-hydrate dehydratase [Cellvibrionaceae bacterium]|nr:NAD(P)H-hydrate dehydratase [Cellvibrionaceae bacterium]